jgi:ABC-type transport system involved in cytochrome c biogenesis permease subunit
MSITARIALGCLTVGLVIPVTVAGVALYYLHAIADMAQASERTHALQSATHAGEIVLMLTGIAAVMSVTLGLLMGRSLAVPIRRLTSQLRDLREARPGPPAPAPPVNDELRQLWQAVQDLARTGGGGNA